MLGEQGSFLFGRPPKRKAAKTEELVNALMLPVHVRVGLGLHRVISACAFLEPEGIDAAFTADGVTVIEKRFTFGRHTGVTLEPRATLVDFDPSTDRLTFNYSGQAPHMMQFILAKHLGLAEDNVRVISRDVGGSFGIKIHTYGDEIATAAAAKLLGRPVKFIADRMESFTTDIHARDHIIDAKIGVDGTGKIVGMAFDDITGIGPFSMYPRTSAIEAN